MFTVTLRKLYSTKILVKTAVVPRKYYNYIIYQGNSSNLGEFFWIHFNLKFNSKSSIDTSRYFRTVSIHTKFSIAYCIDASECCDKLDVGAAVCIATVSNTQVPAVQVNSNLLLPSRVDDNTLRCRARETKTRIAPQLWRNG
jgi:hypothetical protein